MDVEDALLRRRSLLTWVFNPFHYLAGEKALPLGVVAIAATAVVGYFTNTHVDGVLDVHTGSHAPFGFYFVEGLVDWMALGLLLVGMGRLVSASRQRFIDVFGMPALARMPFLPAVGLGGFIPECVATSVRNAGNLGGCGAAETAVFVLVALVSLLLIIWAVVLMYNAFSVACNVRGGRGVASFIVALLLAEVLSKAVIIALARRMLVTP
jgi:uncharacterized integral membrane protein